MSISRVDHPAKHTYGYLVRVQRGGRMQRKFVSDVAAGGKRKALAEARKVEAGFVTELDALPKPKPRPGARNTSGVVGVSRTKMKNGARVVAYWQANWRDAEGRRRGAKFSVDQYGEDKAFRLATKARRAGQTAPAVG